MQTANQIHQTDTTGCAHRRYISILSIHAKLPYCQRIEKHLLPHCDTHMRNSIELPGGGKLRPVAIGEAWTGFCGLWYNVGGPRCRLDPKTISTWRWG